MPLKLPTVYMLPCASHFTSAILDPEYTIGEWPNCLAQIKSPLLVSLTINDWIWAEEVKLNVPGPGSKSTVLLKLPPTMMLLLASTVTTSERGHVSPGPPNCFAHTRLPLGSYLATNASQPPI